MACRIAKPGLNRGRSMRAIVRRNDAGLMLILNENHNDAWSLNDLVGRVISRRHHDRGCARGPDASRSDRDVLHGVVLATATAPTTASSPSAPTTSCTSRTTASSTSRTTASGANDSARNTTATSCRRTGGAGV